MANELIINASLPETRIALMENGQIQDLLVERASDKGIVGNIYKGRVTRVLPGMQAAFVDIGLEKAAFLYVDDVFVNHEIFDEEDSHSDESLEGSNDQSSDSSSENASPNSHLDSPEEEQTGDHSFDSPSSELSNELGEGNFQSGETSTQNLNAKNTSSEGAGNRLPIITSSRVISPIQSAGPSDSHEEDQSSSEDDSLNEMNDVLEDVIDNSEVVDRVMADAEDENEDDSLSDEAKKQGDIEEMGSDPNDSSDDAGQLEDNPEKNGLIAPSEKAEEKEDEGRISNRLEVSSESASLTIEGTKEIKKSAKARSPRPSRSTKEVGTRGGRRSSQSDSRRGELVVEKAQGDANISATELTSDVLAEETYGHVTRPQGSEAERPTIEALEGDDVRSELRTENGDPTRAEELSQNEAERPTVEETLELVDDGRGTAADGDANTVSLQQLRAQASMQLSRSKSTFKEQRAKDRRVRPKTSNRPARAQVNIQDLLKEGQEVLVQVAKDPIAAKGARLTCHISLPGRHLVCMPTIDHVGVSRRIERDDERRKFRELVERNRTKKLGFIVRTASGRSHQSEKRVKQDIDYLTRLWDEIREKANNVSAPALVYEDLNSVLRAIRDWVTEDIDKVIVDSRFHYNEIMRFVSYFMPSLKQKVDLYHGDIPIFDAYGISTELSRALERKVWLKSGGYIVIDQAEALVAIDVNTGRFVGKKNLEDTILKTNLEAVQEIAYQLRLRNCGGIIIIDLIDMDREENRHRVYRALEEALKKDRARPTILKISELGLVEMTRKRTRDTIIRTLCESCSHCEGKGFIKSKQSVGYEILREIERAGIERDVGKLLVQAHSQVIDFLAIECRETLDQIERRYRKQIYLQAVGDFHPEQFEVSADKYSDRQKNRGDINKRHDRPQERNIESDRVASGGMDDSSLELEIQTGENFPSDDSGFEESRGRSSLDDSQSEDFSVGGNLNTSPNRYNDRNDRGHRRDRNDRGQRRDRNDRGQRRDRNDRGQRRDQQPNRIPRPTGALGVITSPSNQVNLGETPLSSGQGNLGGQLPQPKFSNPTHGVDDSEAIGNRITSSNEQKPSVVLPDEDNFGNSVHYTSKNVPTENTNRDDYFEDEEDRLAFLRAQAAQDAAIAGMAAGGSGGNGLARRQGAGGFGSRSNNGHDRGKSGNGSNNPRWNNRNKGRRRNNRGHDAVRRGETRFVKAGSSQSANSDSSGGGAYSAGDAHSGEASES